MGREERWSEVQHLRGQDYVLRREADALADAADIYALTIEAGDLSPREQAAPYIAKVAGDAVARHERERHGRLREAELLGKKWVLSNDLTTRMLGADLLQVLRGA
jgi:hypothetical protein